MDEHARDAGSISPSAQTGLLSYALTLAQMNERTNTYQIPPAHLLSPYLFQSNTSQLNPFQANQLQPNISQTNTFRPNAFHQNTLQPITLQQNPLQSNPLRPNALAQNPHQSNPYQSNPHRPNPSQPNTPQTKLLQPIALRPNLHRALIGQQNKLTRHVSAFRKVTTSSPSINGYHFANPGSKHAESHNDLSSTEMRPKKKARFEQTSNVEAFCYDDIMSSVLSFLSVDNQSLVIRVSQQFAKNARTARRNTTRLVVNCMTNCKDYVKTILGNCRKVKTFTLKRTVLTKAQICTILEHCAATIVRIDTIRSTQCCFLCGGCENHELPLYPLHCRDFFMTFLADTLKNLRFFNWRGCFQVDDLLYLARSFRSLEECVLFLSYDYHVVDINIAMEGVKMIMKNNPNLYCLELGGFVGAGEIFLKLHMHECPSLKILKFFDCNVLPPTKKLLEQLPMIELTCFNSRAECMNSI